MNILYLSPRVPFPPERGDKIRSFFQVKHLAKNNKIFLGTTYDRETDIAYLGKLRKYCKKIEAVHFHRWFGMVRALVTRKPFSVCAFYDRRLQTFVDDCLERYNIDVVLCYCSSMAEYIFRARKYRENSLGSIRLFMDFVDLDSDKWAQYAHYSRSLVSMIYALEEKRLKKYELLINQSFHGSIFVAQREVNIFKRNFPQVRNIYVIPNGVNCDFFSPPTGKPTISISNGYRKEKILVFPGVMDYFANVDGVCWFCEKILPRIRRRLPDVRFVIVGQNPVAAVKRLARIHNVTVTGYVPDIRKYYWMADVCVIPLRIARGLQNKVLEAMAAGNAVVATSNASDGINCVSNKDILIANEEDEFAEAVILLLSNSQLREQIGMNAMEMVRRNYSWEINMKKLENLLAGC